MNTLQTSILHLLPADTPAHIRQGFTELCWWWQAEQCNTLKWEKLVATARSISEVIAEAFPHLSPRDLVALNKWALGETLKAIAEATGLSERQVGRILAQAREQNPVIYNRIKAYRKLEAKMRVYPDNAHKSLS